MNIESDHFAVNIQDAVTLLQQDKLLEAQNICNKILTEQPRYAQAWHVLGVIRMKQQQYDNAIDCYQKALEMQPNNAEVYNNLGNVLQILGRFDEALANYHKALRTNPNYVQTYNNLGILLAKREQYEEALVYYQQALQIKPDYAEALYNQGSALQSLRRFDEAITCYNAALVIKPNYVEVYNNLGNVMQLLKRYDEAIGYFHKTLAIKPDYAQAHYNLGNTLESLNQFDAAIASYLKALHISPDHVEAYNNLGNALQLQNRFDEAIHCYQKAMTIKPSHVDSYNNLGVLLTKLNRYHDAITCYQSALIVKPNHPDAIWNEALALLTLGDFAAGWKKYEARFKKTLNPIYAGSFTEPLWLGKENISGKSILLHAEQGLGDCMQFIRYATLVAELNATVYVQAANSLKTLLATVKGIKQVFNDAESLPQFDFHCPLISLPLAFNTQINTIPSHVPYLTAARDRAAVWAQQFKQYAGYKIGLVWAGNPKHKNDKNRSLDFSELIPLLDNSACCFFSLQKEPRDSEMEALRLCKNIIDLGPELTDFNETAAVVSQLDLVISVDTAVAHLAGALSKPVWLLIPFAPEWRWMLSRNDSPWYPTMTIFRQPQMHDWISVIQAVQQQLVRKLT